MLCCYARRYGGVRGWMKLQLGQFGPFEPESTVYGMAAVLREISKITR